MARRLNLYLISQRIGLAVGLRHGEYPPSGIGFPLFGIFMHYYKKAKRQGVIPARTPAGRTLLQSVLHYVHDFNVVGLLLLSAGFAFLLLPFNLYTM